ncbi:hypothetical protein DE146DRAFT_787002 [Phaeosphaeria sp. MPI-PUGE-AT-0046c]|nr:hypothetical protein DE146DRAFT_787002 [Phaeosphaeria sp. MPI-PUGE-AT-0046c]
MSSNLPLRTVRIPALRQQCLFQHRRCIQTPRAFSTTRSQDFASTTPRSRGGQGIGQDRAVTKAAFKYQMGMAPKVQQRKSQEEGAMQEDIGLLQDTVIRASLSKLPSVLSPAFWGYMWKLLKTKASASYSRVQYNRCLRVKGWERWKRVDRWKGGQIKYQARTLYKQLYLSFAQGDMTPMSKYCLPPILREFENNIKARGPRVKMDWKIVKGPKLQIVSHRASLLGEDQPDSAFRQVVLRVTSTQEVTVSRGRDAVPRVASQKQMSNGWRPSTNNAELNRPSNVVVDVTDASDLPRDSSQRKKVVEYMVLQKRVVDGKQDPQWKIWGFAQESTPQSIAEDDEYWRQTLSTQTAAT